MKKKCSAFEDRLPLPSDDGEWVDFSQKSYYVDKTLLIKELIDRRTYVALCSISPMVASLMRSVVVNN